MDLNEKYHDAIIVIIIKGRVHRYLQGDCIPQKFVDSNDMIVESISSIAIHLYKKANTSTEVWILKSRDDLYYFPWLYDCCPKEIEHCDFEK